MLWRLYGTPCSISDCIGYLSPIHNPVLTVFLIIQKKIPPPCHNICTYLCFSNEKVKCYERVGKVQNAYLRHHRGDWSLLLRRQKRGKKTKNKKKISVNGLENNLKRKHFTSKRTPLFRWKQTQTLKVKHTLKGDLFIVQLFWSTSMQAAALHQHPPLLCLSDDGESTVCVSLSRCCEGRAALWCYVSDLLCRGKGLRVTSLPVILLSHAR